MSIEKLLREIFTRSGLNRNRDQPLYAFRITRQELESLQKELQGILQRRLDLRAGPEAAAFCLFAAEWFRRHHTEGPWAWQTILCSGLGLSGIAEETMRSRVRQITEDGMAWWGLPIFRTETHRHFLTTLACQGGLPLHTLQRHQGALPRFFRSVLQQHEEYPQEPLEDVVQRHSTLLPKTLDQPEVHALAADLIRAVARLRQQAAPADQAGQARISYLDANHRGWRETVPLRLEDTIAQELIGGLLSQPAAAESGESFGIQTELRQAHGGRWFLARSLVGGTRLSTSFLSQSLGLDEATLPPRMTLFLQADGRRVAVATVARNAEGTSYERQPFGPGALLGEEAWQSTDLAATSGSRELACVSFSGGGDLGRVPAVFAASEPFQLVGMGSLRTKRERVLIALPDAADWSWEGEAHVSELARTRSGRRLLEVSGRIWLRHPESGSYLVQTEQAEEEVRLFELRGDRLRLGSTGTEVWRGRPLVWETSFEETPRQVRDADLQWRSSSESTWRPWNDQCRGNGTLRVFRQGETLYQTSICLFPAGFQLQVVPEGAGAGQLVFRQFAGVQIYPAQDAALQTQVETKTGQSIVQVNLHGERPSHLRLRMVWEDGQEATVRTVCPCTWIGILDAVGRPIDSNLEIPLDLLDGLRLHYVSAEDQQPWLTGQRDWLLSPLRCTSTQGVYELPLSSVQSQIAGLLAQSDDPDSFVRLRVIHPPNLNPLYRFRVSRYWGRVEQRSISSTEQGQSNTLEVWVPEETQQALGSRCEELHLELTRFGYPKHQVAEQLWQTISPGRWQLPADELEPGIYLATAYISQAACLRPLRITHRPQEISNLHLDEVCEEEEFDAALGVVNPQERQQAWDAFVNRLAANPGHLGWHQVNELLTETRSLPVTTYETVAALVRNPDAAALVGLRHVNLDWLWDRLEELPFLWCLIPISSWVRVVSRVSQYQQAALSASGLEQQELNRIQNEQAQRWAAQLPIRRPYFACLVGCLYASGFPIPNPDSIVRLMPNAQEDLRRRLFRERDLLLQRFGPRNTQSVWPSIRLRLEDSIRERIRPWEIRDRYRHEWAVSNAPLAAAAYAVSDLPVSHELTCLFHLLRGVDPTWFEQAYEIALFLMAGQRLAENPHCFLNDWCTLLLAGRHSQLTGSSPGSRGTPCREALARPADDYFQ